MNFRRGEGLLGNVLEMRRGLCARRGQLVLWASLEGRKGCSQGLQLLCCERTSPASKNAVLQEERCRLGGKMEKCQRCIQAQRSSRAGIDPVTTHHVRSSTYRRSFLFHQSCFNRQHLEKCGQSELSLLQKDRRNGSWLPEPWDRLSPATQARVLHSQRQEVGLINIWPRACCRD